MSSYFPLNVLDSIQRDLGRPFLVNGQAQAPAWQPQVDIIESDEAWLLSMDVPGVDRDAIDITVDKQVLTVKAERKIEYGENRASLRERRSGEFSRHFKLPDSVDAESIIAKVDNGVLTLQLPKLVKPEPRKITVQ